MTVTSGSVSVPGQVRSMAQPSRIVKQSIYDISVDPLAPLGHRLPLGDGRVFHYARAGAVALSDGKLTQSSIPEAQHSDMLITPVAAIGDTKVTVTLGSTAAAANLYAEGTLHFNNEIPEGSYYKVANHPAAALSTNLVVTLYDPLVKATVAATSKATLTKNPYDGVIITPTGGLSAPPMGVPIVDVTIAYYFWLQTWGPCAVLTSGTIVIGQNVGWITGADGQVGLVSAYTTVVVGSVMQVNATTEYSLIFLRIAP